MTSDDETPRRPYRGSIRSGSISLIAAIALVLWLALAAWLGVHMIGDGSLGVIATIVFFVSWVAVPVLVVLVLVFGIIALLLNSVLGKILGAAGIALPIVAALLFWNSIGGFGDGFLG